MGVLEDTTSLKFNDKKLVIQSWSHKSCVSSYLNFYNTKHVTFITKSMFIYTHKVKIIETHINTQYYIAYIKNDTQCLFL